MRLMILGTDWPGRVGRSLQAAAGALGLDSNLLDTSRAYDGSALRRRASWYLLGKRPPRLSDFQSIIMERVRDLEPRLMLTTGHAPLTDSTARSVRERGITLINFSTDDPWGPGGSRWFRSALQHYDFVFSPRRANLEQLNALNGPQVAYLPFGFDPAMWYPERLSGQDETRLGSDVLFVGGGDRDRAPLLQALVQAKLRVATYGGYWNTFPGLSGAARGIHPPDVIRRATCAAKVSLCLVRRANRDGHVMRTFEMAAMGGAMLVESTEDHRLIFGEEGKAVRYFSDTGELVQKARELVADPSQRQRLGAAARKLAEDGGHTYRDRLSTMLRQAGGE